VGGERRRHEDHRRVGAGLLDRLADRVEHRHPIVERLGAALAGHHVRDHLRAVLEREPGVELPGLADNALNQKPGDPVDESAHWVISTIFCAASRSEPAEVIFRPLSSSSCLPSSTLVPSSRTTSGTCRPTSLVAAITPRAIVSHFMIPPKMLTRMPLMLGSLVMILNAAVTRSSVAPPPTSRKLAGSPPKYLMMSMVDIASPAPLTMQPMLPSSAT